MNDLNNFSIRQIVSGIRKKQFSPTDVAYACIDRYEKFRIYFTHGKHLMQKISRIRH